MGTLKYDADNKSLEERANRVLKETNNGEELTKKQESAVRQAIKNRNGLDSDDRAKVEMLYANIAYDEEFDDLKF
mgnify:CR=1 FL=1